MNLWKNRRLLVAVLCVVSLVVFATVAAASDPVHWGYEGAEGPENWGDLSPDFALCASGKEQSPINVPSTATVNPADITFNYQPTALNIVNNGHTVQVNYDAGSSIVVGGKQYDLLQFHFHAPSEHTLDQRSTDMELHLVHKAADGQLAVVGVMLTKGAENAAFNPVLDNMPATAGDPTTVGGVQVNAADLLPATRTYYRYNGSLTTPPCSEGVQWLLMSTALTLSDAQVQAYQKLYEGNNRPVQPLNARSFLLTSALSPGTLPTTGGEAAPLAAALLATGLLAAAAGYALRRKAA